MTYPAASANMIVLWDRWFDHLTKKGLNATITATPRLAPNQVGTGTPNLRSTVDQAAIKTGKWTTLPMPSGLWALPLLSNNDQQFGAFGGYDIAAGKEPIATVELLESTPTIPLTQEMFDALTVACSQTPGASPLTLQVGDPVQAVWIGNAAVVSAPAPIPPTGFLDSAQTTSLIATYTWRPRGAWSAATAYEQRDVVNHLGSGWIASGPNQGKTPGVDSVWVLVAAKGDTGLTGQTGQTGQTGPANSLSIGTVTTGAAGSSASAQITGTAPSQSLSLTVPRGNTGNTGPANSLSVGTVTTGAAGSSASAQITGTPPTQTLDLTVPRGATGNTGNTGQTGQTGQTGPANSLAIGTVSTGAAGSSASASVTGTAPSQTLNLTVPRGDTGSKGDKGDKGDPGTGSVSTVDGDAGPAVVLPSDGVQSAATKRSLGTGAQQAASGNDSRITGALNKFQNLNELSNKATARVNLGLVAVAASGSAADLTSGVLDDARIPETITRDSELATAIGAVIAELRGAAPDALNDFLEVATRLQQDQDALSNLLNLVGGKLTKAQNLADLPDVAAARTNLGVSAPPTTATAIRHVAPDGNDANSGLSAGSPKATLAAAIAALPSGTGVVELAPGAYPQAATDSYVIDVSKVQLLCRGQAALNWSAAPSAGYAMWLFSSVDYLNTWRNWRPALRGVVVRGNMTTPLAGSGIQLGHDTNTQNAVFGLHDGGCQGFAVNLYYLKNVWRVAARSFHLRGSGSQPIVIPSTATNSGENMNFHDCMIEGRGGASLTVGFWHFHSCSFDICPVVADGTARVYLHGCHLENPGDTSNGYRFARALGTSLIVLEACDIVLNPGAGTITQALFEVADANVRHGLVFRDSSLGQYSYYSPETVDGVRVLVAGFGRVIADGWASNDNSYGFAISRSANVIYNGDAELGNTNGWVKSGTGDLTVDTTMKNSGAASLKASAAAGQAVTVYQEFPMTPQAWVMGSLWRSASKTGTTSSVAVQIKFFNRAGNQLTTAGYSTQVGTDSKRFSAVAPVGTAYARLEFYLVGGDGTAVFNFDDVLLSVV